MSTFPPDQKYGQDVMTGRSSPHRGTPDLIGKSIEAGEESPHLATAKDVNHGLNDNPIDRTETETTRGTESIAPAQAHPNAKWYRKFNPLRLRSIPPVPKERQVSKEYGAGFFSIVTFQWMSSIMTTGYLRRLELQDIWLVNPDRSCEAMSSRLEASFERRVAVGDRYPLLWATYETFKVEFWIGGICQLFASILQVMSPFTTRYLIQFATDAWIAQQKQIPGPDIGHGLGIAIGIAVMQVLQCMGTSQFMYWGMLVGGQSKAVLINMIFTKAIKLSSRAKAGGKAFEEFRGQKEADDEPGLLKSTRDGFMESVFNKKKASKTGPRVALDVAPGISGDGTGWSNGRIITLMSVDADRIDQACGMFHLLWTSPIIIIITLIVLVVNIGYSALSGYALLVLGIPLLAYAIRSLLIRRRKINKITDQRVSLTQEILQAVRFVKYFGWESSFLDRLNSIRKREITAIQILLSIRNAILCVSLTLPVFASMLAFITYSLSQHVLTPAPIFSSLALFNSLRMPLNMLPIVISQVTDAWTAFVRIQEFFLAEEQSNDISWNKGMTNAIDVDHTSFTWERMPESEEDRKKKHSKVSKTEGQQQETENGHGGKGDKSLSDSDGTLTQAVPFHLNELTFTAGRNELIAIIGTVGCGKSSLLSALAGDMRMTDGSVTMGVSSRAFCPQYAWIQNTSVKNNILFGQEYDEAWYKQVVEACALQADLAMLPAGDSTEIGERGITVSGGQKQRLNVARAIYFDADVVLLDDPLSAVDAHVGRHIMDNAICGLLKDKCRILATHQLHILSRCDRIIVMSEGHIDSVDTFDNLMKDSELFQRLMATTAQEENQTKEDSDNEEEHVDEKIEAKKSKKQEKAVALMQAEERAADSVSWSVWGAYMAASGFILNWPLVAITLLLANGANVITNLWLSYWISNKFNLSQGQYIGIYAGLGACQVLVMFTFSTILTTAGTNSSKTMLQRAMTRVLRAPMSFFDTTPLGRITNRFSKDVHTMDNKLTDAMRIYFLVLTMIITVMILIIVFFHYFAIALGPLFILFIFAAHYYRASARELKRHEAVLRSTVFAQFGEGLSGTASIRAYGLQDRFIRQLQRSIDEMDGAYFLTFSNQRWLGIRLDAVGTTLVLVTGILVVTSRFNVSPSISGLVLSYILSTVQMFQFTIRQLAEMENDMNSTERLHYYGTQIEKEAPLHLAEVGKSWPDTGAISFSNIQMRYRDGLPLVLRGLNMEVRGGERIGIVGRTGAGKSSIMSALFRLTELSGGSIKIDGVDIAIIGLHDLRSRLAIIPQDPALFRGTVRSNLDPFNEHSDLELWSALRKADLVDQGESPTQEDKTTSPDNEKQAEARPQHRQQQRIHLDTSVDEEGLNFSLGQRQLMALARALVRNSRIIVCDEATSSVDFETDQKIQQTMATGFKGKTLLCIAHRLRTIIHYDRICVMDQGRIAELDTPVRLWEGAAGQGVFRGMCVRSGIKREDFT